MDTVQKVVDLFNKSAAGSKFFQQANKRGETFELKAELNADTKAQRKDAVKKVIANMTIGKDVSMLFADVVKNMQTEDLEMKKLVYLYLTNYAKSQPELVILAVNTFVKDADDPNPLIRALAIRTMGCLRVGKITDYICEPLKKSLKDDHPYVRKTAAICVAKLHDLNPDLCWENGFISILQDLLSDPNPMVVANSVASLLEIKENSTRKDILVMNNQLLNKLLTALNESTEWGQIGILEALAAQTPEDPKDVEVVLERVTPRLQHVNSSVVLSAIKVLLVYLDYSKNEESIRTTLKKMAPPLVSLLSAPPEVQYLALRNIHLILQKRPDILSNEIRVFFCKYNDPPYVKLEKLDIMITLAQDQNVDQVISELKEYANEVDVGFVRKSVNALGRCAVKLESSAERCVAALLDLIKNKVNYVVQESIIVIKDIFRKFPNRYESIIPTLCENLESLDEPEAKASMIWIIGEYAQKIENAQELIVYFLENFKVEPPQVQLQLLTATVKLFLKKPQQTQELVQKILQTATTQGESSDLRDKAYIYWRLLSSDPQVAKTVVLSDKPPITQSSQQLSPLLLKELIYNLSHISSIYHKPAQTFVTGKAVPIVSGEMKEDGNASGDEDAAGDNVQTGVADLLDLDFGNETALNIPASTGMAPVSPVVNLLNGPSIGPVSPPGHPLSPTFSSGSITTQYTAPTGIVPPKQLWLSSQQAKGFELSGTFSRRQGQVFMDMTLSNKSLTAMTDFAIQFNTNSFGLVPAGPLPIHHPLPPNQSHDLSVALQFSGPVNKTQPIELLQVAFKNNIEVFYFQTLIPVHVLFTEEGPTKSLSGGALTPDILQLLQDSTAKKEEFSIQIPVSLGNIDNLKTRLLNNNIGIFSGLGGKQAVLICLPMNIQVVGDWMPTGGVYGFILKSKYPEVLPSVRSAFELILQQ